jgi:glycosyltransferase involved in cell wall biosynthesis
MSCKRVSILVLTFQNEGSIEACLRSVLSQDYSGLIPDIVLWDNCSTDQTTEKAKLILFGGNIEYQIITENTNRFLSGSEFFREAIFYAKGDYIAIIDGDDTWIDPQKTQKQIACLENNDAIILCGTLAEFFNVKTDKVDYLIPHPNEVGIHESDYLALDNILTNSTVVFREKLKWKLPESFDWAPIKDLPVWALGTENSFFEVLPDVTTRYNSNHGGNISLLYNQQVQLIRVIQSYTFIIKNLNGEKSKTAWITGLNELISRELAKFNS